MPQAAALLVANNTAVAPAMRKAVLNAPVIQVCGAATV